jgi:cation transport ATPase
VLGDEPRADAGRGRGGPARRRRARASSCSPATTRARRRLGGQLGLDDVRWGLLPEDKLAAMEALLAQHEHVAMVGDGINDTPALARASVGIALGGAASGAALETADS